MNLFFFFFFQFLISYPIVTNLERFQQSFRKGSWKVVQSQSFSRLGLEDFEQIRSETFHLSTMRQCNHGPGAFANDLNNMGQGLKQILEFGISVIRNTTLTSKVVMIIGNKLVKWNSTSR